MKFHSIDEELNIVILVILAHKTFKYINQINKNRSRSIPKSKAMVKMTCCLTHLEQAKLKIHKKHRNEQLTHRNGYLLYTSAGAHTQAIARGRAKALEIICNPKLIKMVIRNR